MRSVKSLHQTKKKHTGFDLFEAKDEIFLKRKTRDYVKHIIGLMP